MGKQNIAQEQSLVVVNDSFLRKVTKSIRKFFFKGNVKDMIEKNAVDYQYDDDNDTIKYIYNNFDFVQSEILDARKAFRKYVINNNKDISLNLLLFIKEKIEENELKIRKIIKINNDEIDYNDIINLLDNEIKNIDKFKKKNMENGRYNVPIGVIGVECINSKEAIKNIFKAISTRNSIIILHDNYSKYSSESLILLIVKECLKCKFVDDNIIQMLEKEEIDLTKLDKLIKTEGKSELSNFKKCIYIYQENEDLESKVLNEVERLQNIDYYSSYEIKPVKGDFGDVINYLNINKPSAVCMYTENKQKAYKFINWIDSPNVFINTGVQGMGTVNSFNQYYNCKYVLHKGV